MSSRLDEAMRFHQTALNTRAYRQQVIASNIANADTPNYKARDVDFREALTGALAGKSGSLALSTTSARHLAAAGASPLEANLKFRNDQQGAVDGNTVNMDVGAQRLCRERDSVPGQRHFHQWPDHRHAAGHPGPVRSRS
jgi:flagellar basal-body rod protein FlgB